MPPITPADFDALLDESQAVRITLPTAQNPQAQVHLDMQALMNVFMPHKRPINDTSRTYAVYEYLGRDAQWYDALAIGNADSRVSSIADSLTTIARAYIQGQWDKIIEEGAIIGKTFDEIQKELTTPQKTLVQDYMILAAAYVGRAHIAKKAFEKADEFLAYATDPSSTSGSLVIRQWALALRGEVHVELAERSTNGRDAELRKASFWFSQLNADSMTGDPFDLGEALNIRDIMKRFNQMVTESQA